MLMQRYESVPMSLADACLVRMSEIYPNSSILTLDSDFTIYRKHRHQIIPLIMPDF
jgi:predicted nucleic acid-binding protein